MRKFFEKIINKIKTIKKRSILIMSAGIVMAILSIFLNKKSIYVRPNEIERKNYGQSKSPYKINVAVENLSKDLNFDVSVSPRKYTKEEADAKFDEKMDYLLTIILNQNDNFDSISTKLNFPQQLGDGINATYSFEPEYKMKNERIGTTTKGNETKDKQEPKEEKKSKSYLSKEYDYIVKYQKLIDGSGNIKNDDFIEDEEVSGYINIRFSTDVKDMDSQYRSCVYKLACKVVSVEKTVLEKFKTAFLNTIKKVDANTIDEKTIKLPDTVLDYKIKYKDNLDLSFLVIIILAAIIVFILDYKEIEKVKEAEREKKRMLELDYSNIISKVLIYVSSGMTIRNSFYKLADSYIHNVKIGISKRRTAYDEIVIVKRKCESGYSEIKAYEDMAKNINLRIYTRFLNVLIQSIQNGNKELKNILNMEAQDALYERKQRAKKLGEEAQTKLILPLMLMLIVIIIVIMVPAFMSM